MPERRKAATLLSESMRNPERMNSGKSAREAPSMAIINMNAYRKICMQYGFAHFVWLVKHNQVKNASI